MSKFVITFFCISIIGLFSLPVMGAIFTVTKIADTNDGVCDSDCSLREALAAADAASGEDTVLFDPALFSTAQTIVLAGSELYVQNTDFTTVTGPGAKLLTISGNNLSRIITIGREAKVNISGITFTNGNGVGTQNSGRAGAVYVYGSTLNLSDCVIKNNTASTGGGITNASSTSPTPAVDGKLTMNNCLISGNTSTSSGGGMQNFSTSIATISNSTFTDNQSGGSTGGGGIQANGFINMYNVTFSGNRAPGGNGGGIQSNGTQLILNNVTVTNNTSTNNAGGIHRASSVAGIFLRNTIISGNNGIAESPDVSNIASGTFGSLGNNLIGNTGTSNGWIAADIVNASAQLTPLGSYGGDTWTHLTMATSPTRNAGNICVRDITCPSHNPAAAITLDQRGASRVSSIPDIGATEWDFTYIAEYPDGQVGEAYDFLVIPDVSTNTISFSKALPPGITPSITQSGSLSGTPTDDGVFQFGLVIENNNGILTVPAQITISNTDSSATVTGMLLSANGFSVSNASVEITDGQGFVLKTRSTPFGYFTFQNVPTGTNYTISVASKQHTFNSVQQQVTGNISNIVIQAVPAFGK